MMLGAHALRTKKETERKERERKDRAHDLQKAAKRLGEAASVLASSSACRVGNRAHSIYDFAALSARTSDDQHNKNPKLKSRLSLNVGTLASAREPAKKKRPSFQALLSGRSQSGPPEHLQSARLRADSAQSSKSIYSASTLSSAGSRLLRWLGIGGEVNGRRPPTSSRKSPSKKCKRRQSAL